MKVGRNEVLQKILLDMVIWVTLYMPAFMEIIS